MKRALGIVLAVVIGVSLLLVALVSLLGASEGGTRLLVAQAERFLPLRVVNVSGTLWGEIKADAVGLQLESGDLEIHRLTLGLRLLPLIFDNEVHLLRASADAVVFNPADDAPASTEPALLELPAMPVRLRVDALQLRRVQIADIEIANIAGSARWTEERLVVTALQLEYDGIAARLNGRMEDGPNPVLSAEIGWAFPEMGLEGSGSLAGSAGRLEVDHQLAGDYQARATGLLDLVKVTAPGFDLQVTVEPLSFGDLTLSGLQGTVQGTLGKVLIAAESLVETGMTEPFPVRARLQGPAAGPADIVLSSDPLAGRLEASGRLDWAEEFDLQLAGYADALDLSGLADDVEVRASGFIDLVYRSQLLQLSVRDLSGTFNDRPVIGAFDLRQTEDGWKLASLEADIGGNRVVGSGELNQEMVSLSGAIEAPMLAQLGLDLSGDLQGNFDATGRWPELDGSMELSSTRLEGFELAGSGLSAAATLSAGTLTATLTADAFSTRGLNFHQVDAEAAGALDDLEVKLKWADGNLVGSYGRAGDQHRFSVAQLEARFLDMTWAVDQPVLLTYADEAVSLSPFCILGDDARGCISRLEYQADLLRTEGLLERLPLALAASWLPVQLEDKAFVEGNWQLDGSEGQWDGRLDLAARSLSVQLQESGEDAIALPDLSLQGNFSGSDLRLELEASNPGLAVKGRATVTPLVAEGALAGRLTLEATDLSVLRAVDHRIGELSGQLRGAVDLSGTLAAPRFEGLIEAIDGGLRFTDPDVVLDDIDIALNVDDSGAFELTGSVFNRGSEIQLGASGSGVFVGELAATASLAGSKIEVEHPDWKVAVSPELKFDYGEGKGRLSGQVEIPKARIQINTLPASVPRPSDDVVVLGRDENVAAAVGPIEVDLDIVIGDDVSLSAAGIEASLTGALNARLDRRGRTRVRGKLDVTGGVVRAQGQELTLESGSIVYNGPLDNPFLDVRAIRMIDTRSPPIKVGLHIQGTAENLTSTVFSEPPMEDARALSFLVLGRDLEQGSGGDSNQLMAAAVNLGLSQAGSVTSELKRFTGLDEISAESEGEDSFAVVAGKRLTNKIYIRYAYDTMTAMSAVLVRYSLAQRWHLVARSSEDSSMDIMYTIER